MRWTEYEPWYHQASDTDCFGIYLYASTSCVVMSYWHDSGKYGVPLAPLNAVTYSRVSRHARLRGSSHGELRHLCLAGKACSLWLFLSAGGDADATKHAQSR